MIRSIEYSSLFVLSTAARGNPASFLASQLALALLTLSTCILPTKTPYIHLPCRVKPEGVVLILSSMSLLLPMWVFPGKHGEPAALQTGNTTHNLFCLRNEERLCIFRSRTAESKAINTHAADTALGLVRKRAQSRQQCIRDADVPQR